MTPRALPAPDLPEHPDFLWRNPEPKSSYDVVIVGGGGPRPGDRALPGEEPRHHQRRGAGEGVAGGRQHGPQHHADPLQLPVGRERGDLRALPQALGGPRGRPGLPDPVQPARRAEPGAHPAGRARQRAPGRGEQAQRDRRRVARRGRGPQGLPDRQHVDRHPLPGARRHLPAAGGHRQARLRRLGLRPARRRGRGRPDPGLRGHRLRHRAATGSPACGPPAATSPPGRSSCAPRGTRRCSPTCSASACRCRATRCRRWSPSCWSPCTRRSSCRTRCTCTSRRPTRASWSWGRASTRTTATASAARST